MTGGGGGGRITGCITNIGLLIRVGGAIMTGGGGDITAIGANATGKGARLTGVGVAVPIRFVVVRAVCVLVAIEGELNTLPDAMVVTVAGASTVLPVTLTGGNGMVVLM